MQRRIHWLLAAIFSLTIQACGDDTVLENCSNGVDDDLDGQTDCDDTACRNVALCAPPEEEVCGNGLDDDGNGLTDCDDAACAAEPDCQPEPCGNDVIDAGEQCDGANVNGQSCQTQGFDGGSLACNSNCFFNIAGCADEVCNDGVDNDFDGQADCADANCAGDNACNELGECSDNTDNDNDGQADCNDTDCANDAACLPFCGDGLINQAGEQCEGTNLNGQSCQSLGFISGTITCSAACTFDVTACVVEVCNDGLDNNNNALIDCQDPACASDPLCASGVETFCEDFTDNDGDGLVDCEDQTACQTLPACTPGNTATGGSCATANQCQANNADPFCINDGDLNINFPGGYCSQFCNVAANDCGGDGVCVNINLPSGSGLCFDGCAADNDCRAGYSCQAIGAARVCVVSEDCDNGVEDDLDGYIDCADADCAGDPACPALAELEPNDLAAQSDPFVEPFIGSIGTPGDLDFIAVNTLVAGTTITATIVNLDGTPCAAPQPDTDLALFDTNGTTQLAFNDDIDGQTNFCSQVVAVVGAPGTYFLRVRSSAQFQPTDLFTYRVVVVLTAPQFTEVEPNNVAAQADPFTAPFFAQITPTDVDFISVTTTVANTVITAEIGDGGNGGCAALAIDSDVAIFDRNGTTILGFNDDINGVTNFCSRVSAVATVPGTYFIRARSSLQFAPNGAFTYQLLVTLRGLAEIESNNTAGLSDPFVDPFFARINPAGDLDFISVTTTAPNTTITAEVADLENGQCLGLVIDSDVTIFDRNGTTQLAFNDDINAQTNFCSRASAVAAVPGTYFIRVRSSVAFQPNGLFDYRALITLQ